MTLLDQKTLVLNRSWHAIHVTTVRRALGMLYRDAARVVSPDTFEIHDFESWAELSERRQFGSPAVSSVRLRVRIPEVIVLNGYDGVPVRRVSFSRRNIYKRDNYTCQYCGRRYPTEDLSIDHVVPRSRGGKLSWTNCVIACLDCNVRKGNRTLAAARMRLISRPAKPDWKPYLELTLGYRRPSWEKFISDRVLGYRVEGRLMLGSRYAIAIVAMVCGLLGCAGRPSQDTLPSTITADFFPVDARAQWDFEIQYPGFPDRPSRFRFSSRAPLSDGSHPVVATSPDPGVPIQQLRLVKDDQAVRMFLDGEPIVLLRFGARLGDTWPYHPHRPEFIAQLTDVRYERILGSWTTVAEVKFHAGDVSTKVTRTYWFAPDIGWVRISQRPHGGALMDAILVDYERVEPAPARPE